MTEVTTQTLADFLLARIAEDEAAATAALASRTRPRSTPPGRWIQSTPGACVLDGGPNSVARSATAGVIAHIARHDPARVLAECEAKRRIVGQVERNVRDVTGGWLDRILHLLALPYADHPDYRDEWRP